MSYCSDQGCPDKAIVTCVCDKDLTLCENHFQTHSRGEVGHNSILISTLRLSLVKRDKEEINKVEKNFFTRKEMIKGIKYIDIKTIYVILFGILCRLGAFFPDPSGDLAIQWGWMNITINLPMSKWYDTEEILPTFFPIDYPPFSTYHQYLCGLFLSFFEPESLTLWESNQLTYSSKTIYYYLRCTVLISELLIFIPSILLFFYTFYREKTKNVKNMALLLLFTFPGFINIDYQRFQYNNIVFGFSIYSIISTMKGKFRISAVFLAFAVWYKVVALYYSLSFAVYWIASTIKNTDERDTNRLGKILYELGCIVASGALTTFIIWWPWLTVKEVPILLQKFFDFRRPYVENLFSNFWSRLYLVVDLKEYLETYQITSLCLLFTLAFSLPFLYFLAKNPHPKSFLYATSGVSLSFYLFSYMVHEKAILYSIVCLNLTTVFDDPNFFQFSVMVTGFSFYHLKSYEIYYSMQIIFYSISFYYIKYTCKLKINKNFQLYYAGKLALAILLPLDYIMNLDMNFFFWELINSYVFIGICWIYYFILKNNIKVYRNPLFFEATKDN